MGLITDKILRLNDVAIITGLSKSTIWRYEKAGLFVRRRRLTSYAVGYLESEVIEWINNRPRVE